MLIGSTITAVKLGIGAAILLASMVISGVGAYSFAAFQYERASRSVIESIIDEKDATINKLRKESEIRRQLFIEAERARDSKNIQIQGVLDEQRKDPDRIVCGWSVDERVRVEALYTLHGRL